MTSKRDLLLLFLLLVVSVVVRIAALQVDGHNGDVRVTAGWAVRMAEVGPWRFYEGSGSIYPALTELAREGLVTCREETQANRPDRKIITAEDPVEYNFPGINQCQMHDDIGLNFAAALHRDQLQVHHRPEHKKRKLCPHSELNEGCSNKCIGFRAQRQHEG